jgi:hypothetical protein
MPELSARTLGPGKCCRSIRRWVPTTWNGESTLIVELPVGFSVANADGGAKNRIFGHRCRVLSTK